MTCSTCFPGKPAVAITLGDKPDYFEKLKERSSWIAGELVSSFGILTSHKYHHPAVLFAPHDACGETVTKDMVTPLSSKIQQIVSVVLAKRHFAVIRIGVTVNKVKIHDGKKKNSVTTWARHVKMILQKHGLVKIDQAGYAPFSCSMDRTMYEQADDDDSSCGPIGCALLWQIFSEGGFDPKNYQPLALREAVLDRYLSLVKEHAGDLYQAIKIKFRSSLCGRRP